jgi:23S rRNA pseudouridine1911/1915/1917 synthase
MAAIKHPIIGDKTYGKPYEQLHPDPIIQNHIQTLNRQALHAAELAFTHPITHKALHFSCPYPEDFSQLLNVLQKEYPYADRP